ncbi:hypothetical protein [Micromonospora sp. WMMD712]|uniref:hypothetical protein n=1 Tax=Micromonospora sp. WMMD712 TaxID=3016096 RepID=UPI00249BBB2D|nr:hypothetical protein [Micromonospora sp. WMMD712]WFE58874.1 hypothetical protein O7633_19380 [Micromonospora sp. WMMD712]
MEIGSTRSGSRARTWVTPTRVAWLGAAAVALLLIVPIRILGPGDHERQSCGNTLQTDLDRWRGPSDGDYWEKAYRACNSERIDRIGQAVGVVSLTVLAVTLLTARARRRGDEH